MQRKPCRGLKPLVLKFHSFPLVPALWDTELLQAVPDFKRTRCNSRPSPSCQARSPVHHRVQGQSRRSEPSASCSPAPCVRGEGGGQLWPRTGNVSSQKPTKTRRCTVPPVTFSPAAFAFLSTQLRGGGTFQPLFCGNIFFLPTLGCAFRGHHKILGLSKSLLLFRGLTLLPKGRNCAGEVTKPGSLPGEVSVAAQPPPPTSDETASDSG